MTRIQGKQLLLQIGLNGEDPVNYWAQATKVELTNTAEVEEDLDRNPRFFDIRWMFEVEAIQSMQPDSLWSFLFDHVNETADFTYAPHGNEEPTEDQPHFVGRLVIPNPPRIGGEAGEDVTYVFESELPIIEGPHRVNE